MTGNGRPSCSQHRRQAVEVDGLEEDLVLHACGIQRPLDEAVEVGRDHRGEEATGGQAGDGVVAVVAGVRVERLQDAEVLEAALVLDELRLVVRRERARRVAGLDELGPQIGAEGLVGEHDQVVGQRAEHDLVDGVPARKAGRWRHRHPGAGEDDERPCPRVCDDLVDAPWYGPPPRCGDGSLPSPAMRFSVWPSFERPWTEVLDLAQRAEVAGWHGLWYADHFMTDTPDGAPSDAPVLECWAVLAGLAAAVPRLRLGSLVSPTTVHHPAVLAKRACTIDHISDGRLVLGIGAGWQVNEHRAYGIELLLARRAGRALRRGPRDPPRASSTRSAPPRSGGHFTVTDAPCQPKPLQQPLPILVGASGPRMLRATARFADEWNTWGDLPQARRAHRGLRGSLRGRRVGTRTRMRRSVQAMLFVTDDQATTDKLRDRARRRAARSSARAPEIVDAMGRYVEMGFDEFIVPDFNLGAVGAGPLGGVRAHPGGRGGPGQCPDRPLGLGTGSCAKSPFMLGRRRGRPARGRPLRATRACHAGRTAGRYEAENAVMAASTTAVAVALVDCRRRASRRGGTAAPAMRSVISRTSVSGRSSPRAIPRRMASMATARRVATNWRCASRSSGRRAAAAAIWTSMARVSSEPERPRRCRGRRGAGPRGPSRCRPASASPQQTSVAAATTSPTRLG